MLGQSSKPTLAAIQLTLGITRMKLALKIIVLFLGVSCGLVGFSGFLSVYREIAFFEEEMTARHGRLVAAVEPMLHDAWKNAGHVCANYRYRQWRWDFGG